MTDRMGYELRIFYGTAGSTATNLIENAMDVDVNQDPTWGNTTTRGDGSVPPIQTARVTTRAFEASWTMLNKTGDAALTAIRAAAAAGTPLAIRTEDYNGGTGFDGDCEFGVSQTAPIEGEQAFTVTARATRALRTPQLNV